MRVESSAGENPLNVMHEGTQFPLLLDNSHGKGKIAYLATLDSPALTQRVIEWLAGPAPVRIEGSEGALALLTHQPLQKRWILHLISEGAYLVTVNRALVPARVVTARFPQTSWSHRVEATPDRLRISVEGNSSDRLLVLE